MTPGPIRSAAVAVTDLAKALMVSCVQLFAPVRVTVAAGADGSLTFVRGIVSSVAKTSGRLFHSLPTACQQVPNHLSTGDHFDGR